MQRHVKRLLKHPNKKTHKIHIKLYNKYGDTIFQRAKVGNTYEKTLTSYLRQRLKKIEMYKKRGETSSQRMYEKLELDFTDKDISNINFDGFNLDECKF